MSDTKRPAHRPTLYTPELADEFCARLAEGKSVRTVCLSEDMPEPRTIFRWLAKHEEFSHKYAKAKREGIEAMLEEVIDIADDGSNDWMEVRNKDGKLIGQEFNREHVQRSKLRTDVRIWFASKLLPVKYGEASLLKTQMLDKKGDPTDPVAPVVVNNFGVDALNKVAEILEAGESPKEEEPDGGGVDS